MRTLFVLGDVVSLLQAAMRGNTPTAFAPFCLHTEMRLPQRNRKTTDELRVAEAIKAKDAELLRRRQQLQRLQKQERARTASPKVSEASSARSRHVKPFQLASVMRHEREVQIRKQQLQVCSPTAQDDATLFVEPFLCLLTSSVLLEPCSWMPGVPDRMPSIVGSCVLLW